MNLKLKAYLINAIYQWCVDEGYRPYLVAIVDEHTQVPPAFVRDGQIVLNIDPRACQGLVIGDLIRFQARFQGQIETIKLPIGHIISAFAFEVSDGMAFEFQPYEADSQDVANDDEPILTLIKKPRKDS